MAILSIRLEKNDCLSLATRNGVSLAALSPLGKLPFSQSPLSASGIAISTNNDAMRVIEVLARPGWLVTMRMGAGDWPITELCLCGRTSDGNVAGIRPTPDGQVELMRWDSARQFADWWCEAHANQSEEIAQNFIPPPCSLEGFVMVLQAIDAYRRTLLGSLLSHVPSDQLVLTTEEFNAHCLSGMRAHDVRWLTPAFVSLVPGFGEYRMTGGPESAKVPFDRQFLATAFHPVTGEPSVGFGEPGQAMGLEFARSWMHAAGLEARLPAPEGTRATARCFLAPTGVANHVATFVPGVNGSTQINHQTVTGNGLRQTLTAFLEQAASAPPLTPLAGAASAPTAAPASAPTLASASAPVPMMKFCSQCGTQMEKAAGFCPSCGTRQ